MATVIGTTGKAPRAIVQAVGTLDRVWAIGAALLLLAVGIALVRGRAEWVRVPPLVWALIQVPLIWWTARAHQMVRHRRAVRGMVIGALLIAGFFTFPFGRLLGHWLLG